MPEGIRGFQPGRMKTGGRTKSTGVTGRKSSRFVDQLRDHKFNYPKELAEVLLQIKSLRTCAADPKTAAATAVTLVELKFYYNELKSLLPFMAPKLREKEVEVTEDPETSPVENPASTEDLIKALGNANDEQTKPRASNSHPVATGRADLQVPTGTEENLLNVAGEQEEDQ